GMYIYEERMMLYSRYLLPTTRVKMDVTNLMLSYLKNIFFFSSRRRHTRSVSAFLLNRSSDLYESHFVHGRDSLVDILKERGLLSESDAVQPLIGKKS